MHPFLILIVGKLLDFLSEHSDDIVKLIRDQFDSATNDTEVKKALNEFENDPTEESFVALHDKLEAKGEDTQKLAKMVINEATV